MILRRLYSHGARSSSHTPLRPCTVLPHKHPNLLLSYRLYSYNRHFDLTDTLLRHLKRYDYNAMFAKLRDYERQGRKADFESLCLLLKAAAKTTNQTKADMILHKIKQIDPKLLEDKEVQGSLLLLATKQGDFSKAMKVYDKLGDHKTSIHLQWLIEYLAKSKKFWLLEKTINEFEQTGKPIYPATCVHIYSAFIRINEREKAEKYYKKAEDHMNVYVASALLRSFKHNDDLERLQGIHKRIIEANIMTESLNILYIEALSYCGEVDEAIRLLKNFVFRRIVPQLSTYAIVMRNLSKQGEVEKIQDLFDFALDKGLVPDEGVLMTLLSSYSKAGKLTKALNVYHELMPKYNISPSFSAYLALIEGYALFSETDTIKMLEDMKATIGPNGAVYYPVIKMYLTKNNWEKALYYYRESRDLGELQPRSMFLMITAASTPEESNEFFEDFKKEFDSVSLAGVIMTLDSSSFKTDFTYVEYLFNRWLKDFPSLKLGLNLFTTMIEAAGRCKKPLEAFKYYYKIKEAGITTLDTKLTRTFVSMVTLPCNLAEVEDMSQWNQEELRELTKEEANQWDRLVQKWHQTLLQRESIDWNNVEKIVPSV